MARDDRDVIVVERGESHSPLWWLLVGTALGAGLGLLFAPRSGEETRRDLGKRLAKLREVADDALSGLHGAEEDEEPIHRSESELEDEELPSGIEEPPVRRATAGEASPARLELEQRLADARARRRRALAAEEDEEPVA